MTKTQDNAYELLPYLVNYAQNRELVTYEDLMAKIDKYAINASVVLEYIRDEICAPNNLPLLTSIVINKNTGLPGDNWLPEGTSNLTKKEYEEKFDRHRDRVFRFDDWNKILKKLNLEPLRLTEYQLHELAREYNDYKERQVSDDLEDDERLKSEVSKELEEAKALAKSLDFEKVKTGEWFINLLEQVVKVYDRNARATYFQKKYPGLSPEEIADILISVTVRYATIAGAVTGVATSANEISVLVSGGITAALFVGSIGSEMLYLSNIQMRLMLDMSVLYDLQLDLEDPEDILMIFGYALLGAPTEIIGKSAQVAARAGTTRAIKTVVSKGTLESLQKFAQKLGFKILQRTIIKYAIPVVSAAVGSGYNYVTTKSVGKIAKLHFKNRGKVTDELRAVISKQNTYDLAVPAAAMFMAEVDGNVSPNEKKLYRAMLSRMSFEEHTPADFNRLVSDEQSILDAVSQIEDVELRKALIELLTLMAIHDGILANEEREFLTSAAERLGITLDIEQMEKRVKEYQVIVEKNVLEKTAGAMGSAAVTAIGAARQAAHKLKDAFGKAVKRQDSGKPSASPIPTQDDPLDKLKKLKQMLEAELITQGEFDKKRAEILSAI